MGYVLNMEYAVSLLLKDKREPEMTSGIFYVVFRNNFQEFGEGTVVVKDNIIYGGGSTHTYRGRIQESAVELQIEKHRSSAQSIFKKESDYTLKLNLQESGYGYSLKGQILGEESMQIEVDAKYIGALTAE